MAGPSTFSGPCAEEVACVFSVFLLCQVVVSQGQAKNDYW